jgi:dTDP-4-dehydrorhamnose 3,5-epimerase
VSTIELRPLPIAGCYEISSQRISDERGWFLKLFREDIFRRCGLECEFREQYISSSQRNVIRGMHFQLPPADHAKLVFCAHGEVFDVFLDIRRGSPTFGIHGALTLSAEAANAIYLPRGIAHGFCAVSDLALVTYSVTTVYSPEKDCGVRWDSFGSKWPTSSPVLSKRDLGFPSLEEFVSPFTYAANEWGKSE